MQINIIQNNEDIVVIPTAYADMDNPPTFVFRTPNSSDLLQFMYGGENVENAVYSCFKEFKNKIELKNGDKVVEYNTYREFIQVGLSAEISAIHNECMNAIYQRLLELIDEAKKTEKK